MRVSTVFVSAVLAISGGGFVGTAAMAAPAPVTAPNLQQQPPSSGNLLGEYADAALDARRALGIDDATRTLSDQQFAEINKIANADGHFDALLSPARVPGGAAPQVVAAADSPSSGGPGPAQTRVCALNPFDCSRSVSARDDSYNISAARYPTYSGVDDRRDAFRHCTWQALTTKRANADFARQLGDAHEADGNADGTGNPAANAMDQENNAIGRQVGLENENTEDPAIYIRCGDLADTGGLRTLV